MGTSADASGTADPSDLKHSGEMEQTLDMHTQVMSESGYCSDIYLELRTGFDTRRWRLLRSLSHRSGTSGFDCL